MKLSIIIPAYNESGNITSSVTDLIQTLTQNNIFDYEVIIVNDNSTDNTKEVLSQLSSSINEIVIVERTPPGGFGRAIRSGIDAVTGDIVIPYMADASDSPLDVVRYYNKITEGYDCVYGSRFIKGSHVDNYPPMKLIINRIVNQLIRLLFLTKHNDLTNAFKAYRMDVIRCCLPYQASHFNITLEMSLGALIRNYAIATIPISWSGRKWGASNLHIREMGRRYLSTLLRIWCEKALISDDILDEKMIAKKRHDQTLTIIQNELSDLSGRVTSLEQGNKK